MNELIGAKWCWLKEETQQFLLEGAICIDGSTGDTVDVGECIVDLTDELSVSGKVVDGEIVINSNAIIYNPCEGVAHEKESVDFTIDTIMTVTEAAEKWDITEGAIRAAIKSKKFIIGVDYRKAGRITLITTTAMNRVYGEQDE